MKQQLLIGIIGDYQPAMRSHPATEEVLRQAAAVLDVALKTSWLSTESLAGGNLSAILAPYDALWCAPGSPYRSMVCALAAIRYAREEHRPFIGT